MTPFALALFSTDPGRAAEAARAGVEMIVIDWESRGKAERQTGFDTEVNHDTVDDLRAIRAATTARVVCRVNQMGDWTAHEVESAIEAGADEILLPMVRNPHEVETFIRLADGRCGTGILIETVDAVARASDLSSFPLNRVYFGLHDYAIDRRTSSVFRPLVDGTVERARACFEHIPFGFAGLTVPGHGFPIPSELLMGAMVDLRCQFSFLRRSFHRAVQGGSMAAGVARIREALDDASRRTADEIADDRRELERHVMAWPEVAPPLHASFERGR